MTDVRALSGRAVDELTLEAVRRGEVTLPDLRIHPSTLERQAAVADGHANPQLAGNLRRAAELTSLPDDEVMAIYEALRPGRSTPEQLTAWRTRWHPAACPAVPHCSPRRRRSTPAADCPRDRVLAIGQHDPGRGPARRQRSLGGRSW